MSGNYRLEFLDFPVTTLNSPEQFKHSFLDYNHEDWQRGFGGGVFTFNDEGEKYLLIIYQDEYGIGLRHENHERNSTCYSLGNRKLLNHFIEDKDELILPLGTYLSPKNAWLAVEDFLLVPKVRSSRIEWVSIEEIEWDESLF